MIKKLLYTVFFIGIMWVLAIGDYVFEKILIDINSFGIVPRTLRGLIGIVASPFLHANLNQNAMHLIMNSLFLLFLLPITLIFYEKNATKIIWFIILFGGALVWLIARSGTNHVGASGLIFGLITLLFLGGIINHDLKSIFASIAFFFGYSIIIYGVIPTDLNQSISILKAMLTNFFEGFSRKHQNISYEGHLFGAIAGLVSAFIYRNKPRES